MEIQIAQDIRKFKTKDIGNFNIKEVGIIALAIGVGAIMMKVTGRTLKENGLEFGWHLVPSVAILVFGFLKPLGYSFPQFLKVVVIGELFSPRLYVNETDFEYDPDELDEIIGEKAYIPSCWNDNDVAPAVKRSKEDLKEIIS